MQTFLPYENFKQSAECLDRLRLGKQRVEVLQILKELDNRYPPTRWKNHPAVKMWYGYPYALAAYGLIVAVAWINLGYKDTCYNKIQEVSYNGDFYMSGYRMPQWLGNNDFHLSHQSNLLRKNPEHYKQFGWNVQNDLPYVWPEMIGHNIE